LGSFIDRKNCSAVLQSGKSSFIATLVSLADTKDVFSATLEGFNLADADCRTTLERVNRPEEGCFGAETAWQTGKTINIGAFASFQSPAEVFTTTVEPWHSCNEVLIGPVEAC